MRTIRGCLFLLLILFCVPANAQADEVYPTLPSPAEVRAVYLQVSADWKPVPPIVLDAFLVAGGRSLYPGQSRHSAIAYHLSSFVSHERSLLHKAYVYSAILNGLSHDEIQNWYANRVFLGQGCYGVDGAAAVYFGKPINELTLQEVAYLAALPKGPSIYHPVRHHDRALERRNFVLRELVSAGVVSQQHADEAAETELLVRSPLGSCHTD